jgi:hypothetical protein
MSVSEIKFDLLNYVSARYDADDVAKQEFDHLVWGGSPLSPTWQPIGLSIVDRELKWGDFFSVYIGGVLGVTASTAEKAELRKIFESSGELLPVTIDGRDAFIFHSWIANDALDRESSRCRQLENGNWVVYDPAFIDDALPDFGLFRIPETVSLFTQNGGPESFQSVYQRLNLKGLKFVGKPVTKSESESYT